MNRGNHEHIIASLSGRVSPEAITALQTLMTKHTTEMKAIRSNTGITLDKVTTQAKMVGFKSEIRALMVQYPELKTALPAQFGKMHRGIGKMK